MQEEFAVGSDALKATRHAALKELFKNDDARLTKPKPSVIYFHRRPSYTCRYICMYLCVIFHARYEAELESMGLAIVRDD